MKLITGFLEIKNTLLISVVDSMTMIEMVTFVATMNFTNGIHLMLRKIDSTFLDVKWISCPRISQHSFLQYENDNLVVSFSPQFWSAVNKTCKNRCSG